MSQDEIMELIGKGESDTIEFKEAFGKEAIETADAFANTKGGFILIGISDKGKINGVQIAKESSKSGQMRFPKTPNPESFQKLNEAK
jgi:predicted HTH transcriptional regulator